MQYFTKLKLQVKPSLNAELALFSINPALTWGTDKQMYKHFEMLNSW